MATTDDTLRDLALSRGTLDRAALERREPGLVDRLLADPSTRVVEVRGDRAPVSTGADDGASLVVRAPHVGDDAVLAVFLGRDGDGVAYVASVAADEATDAPRDESRAAEDALWDGTAWMTLRDAGTHLGDRDAGMFTTALALANWHRAHGHCPRCGTATEPVEAGWVRRCPADASEHYPRTDPAVIMAVVDADDRLLLGRGATWPEGRFSVLAGFVEPGESFEAAVAREVAEEVGVPVEDVRYLGNQPWPFPSSVMIGFVARARATELELDHAEMAEARWVTREEYRGLLREGGIRTPSGISIAKRLIEHWLGATVESVVA